jgi:hypothetical protein
MGRTVTLGAHEYDVCPQKIGYLINRLGPRLQEALEAEIEGVDGAALIGAKAHDVLKAFIPDLMPLHEFLGYASDEAMRDGEYSESTDISPEPLQIKDAFKAASDVNGGEVLSHLKALLGPTLTQSAVAAITAAVSENARSTISAPSPTSQPPSGGSDPTSSGTTPPTSVPSTA